MKKISEQEIFAPCDPGVERLPLLFIVARRSVFGEMLPFATITEPSRREVVGAVKVILVVGRLARDGFFEEAIVLGTFPTLAERDGLHGDVPLRTAAREFGRGFKTSASLSESISHEVSALRGYFAGPTGAARLPCVVHRVVGRSGIRSVIELGNC